MVSRWLRHTSLRRTLFAAVVLLLTSTVGWLGWRVLSQDQQLASQRVVEDREVAADLVVGVLNQRLSSLERDLDAVLTRGHFDQPAASSDVVLIRIRGEAIRVWPQNRLPYYPHLPPRPASPDAEALVLAGQAGLKAGNFDAALQAFQGLERLGAVPIGDVVGGIPAVLFAHLGRMTVFERKGDQPSRIGAARAIADALESGRWPVSAATYQFLHEQVRRAVPDAADSKEQLALAEAATWLWEKLVSIRVFSRPAAPA